MEVKIACGIGPACRPKSSFLYKNPDGFEIEELPGDYEYYIGTLIAAVRFYGLSQNSNHHHLHEIAKVILKYLNHHSFDQNPEFKQLLKHIAAHLVELTVNFADKDDREKEGLLGDLLENLEHMLDSF